VDVPHPTETPLKEAEMSHHRLHDRLIPLLAAALWSVPVSTHAQETAPAQRSWEVAGLPALNYDSDEGFGYGLIAEMYRHAPGTKPYVFTVQPAVQLSTRGKRDVTVFFDAPHLFPGGWRLDAFVGQEQQLASPYYGLGNRSAYDPLQDAADGPDPYFYRFGRTRRQLLANVQRDIPGTPLRGLAGAGVSSVSIDPTPFDSGTTLLEQQFGAEMPTLRTAGVRIGLIWDTRDREMAPTRGVWSEVLVQRFDGTLGSEPEYTRWTITDRRYHALGSERLIFANRFLLQGVEGDAPLHDLFIVQTSFKQQEGLGGAKTLRGLPKNRYVGRGMFIWNAEVRWRAVDLHALGRPLHVVLTGFADSGRVWEERLVVTELATDLHHGVGGGVRIGMGEAFTVAVDAGRSSGGGTPVYIGLGYLY
jgi:hypothetical protein